MPLIAIGLLLGAYLFGAVPFGLLIGWARGVDIRRHGSGNIGATNAGRVLGRNWGFLVFGLDLLKGLLPTALAGWIIRCDFAQGAPQSSLYLLWVGVAAASVLGHMFPVFLRFKGGKGVATSVGAMLGIYPFFTVPALIVLVIWVVLTLSTRYVSVGSMGAAVAFPVVFGVFAYYRRQAWGTSLGLWPFYVMCVLVAAMVVVRHRSNLRRLLAGVEPQIGQRREAGGQAGS